MTYNRNKRIISLALLGFFLFPDPAFSLFVAPYKKAEKGEPGYYDFKLQEGVFKIRFLSPANSYESEQDRHEDFLELRASEIAVKNGYHYFIILDRFDIGKSVKFVYSHTSGPTVQTRNWTQMQLYSTVIIRCFKEKPTDLPVKIINADQRTRFYKGKYDLK